MTVNEAIQSVSPDVSVKMAIGIHLFANTLLSLGTERHLPFYNGAWNREVYLYNSYDLKTSMPLINHIFRFEF